jgi:hypothetical protein
MRHGSVTMADQKAQYIVFLRGKVCAPAGQGRPTPRKVDFELFTYDDLRRRFLRGIRRSTARIRASNSFIP